MYKLDNKTYFSNVREDILDLIKSSKFNHLLEVGAGACGTTVEIKKRNIASKVTAVELFKIENSLQDSPLLDSFLRLDLNKDLELLENDEYDALIAADVLEHLSDPWTVIKSLENKLKHNGTFILSLPNIRNIKTLKQIVMKGSFAYEDEGVLDRTHLRFFCHKDMRQLAREAGLEIEATSFSIDRKFRGMLKLLPHVIKELLSTQIILVLKKV
jgi:2-polyprenyl-3-methyl-5-hydroxy-6-metoxy-1,4-benzoquinol methylase